MQSGDPAFPLPLAKAANKDIAIALVIYTES
jgi:hypothetical protein